MTHNWSEYVGGSNWLVLIVDGLQPDGLDGEVLTEVAELIESGVALRLRNAYLIDGHLLPLSDMNAVMCRVWNK